jgi:hypothetical protein
MCITSASVHFINTNEPILIMTLRSELLCRKNKRKTQFFSFFAKGHLKKYKSFIIQIPYSVMYLNTIASSFCTVMAMNSWCCWIKLIPDMSSETRTWIHVSLTAPNSGRHLFRLLVNWWRQITCYTLKCRGWCFSDFLKITTAVNANKRVYIAVDWDIATCDCIIFPCNYLTRTTFFNTVHHY